MEYYLPVFSNHAPQKFDKLFQSVAKLQQRRPNLAAIGQ
jgi:hypothetical protein